LYDLDRRIRPVGIAYRKLIAENSALTIQPMETEIRARQA
jgi:hypothetical protein